MKLYYKTKFYLIATLVLTSYFALTFWAGTSICPAKAFTGLPCPGCGMTTAGIALLRGDLTAAIAANAFIFAVPPITLLMIFHWLWKNKTFAKICWGIYLIAGISLSGYYIFRLIRDFPEGPYPMEVERNTIPRKIISLFPANQTER